MDQIPRNERVGMQFPLYFSYIRGTSDCCIQNNQISNSALQIQIKLYRHPKDLVTAFLASLYCKTSTN